MAGVVANVCRPAFRKIPETSGVAGEKGAVGFLVIAPVPSDGGKEAISCFLSRAQGIALAARLARFLDKLAQGDGSAARLCI